MVNEARADLTDGDFRRARHLEKTLDALIAEAVGGGEMQRQLTGKRNPFRLLQK